MQQSLETIEKPKQADLSEQEGQPNFWIFKALWVIYVFSLIFERAVADSFGGKSPAIVTLTLLAFCSHFFKAKNDYLRFFNSFLWTVIFWISVKVLFGSSTLYYGLILASLPIFAYKLSSVECDKKMFEFQILSIGIMFSLFVITFYLGMWEDREGGRLSIWKHNSNTIGTMLSISVMSLIYYIRAKNAPGKVFFTIMLLAVYAIPIWYTGSRKSIFLLLLFPPLYMLLINKSLKKNLAIIILVSALGYVVSELGLVQYYLGDNKVFQDRFVEHLEDDIGEREEIIRNAQKAISKSPLFGYPLQSPSDNEWLKNNIGFKIKDPEDPVEWGTAPHYGHLSYLIMGGYPILLLYLLAFWGIGKRLYKNYRLSTGTDIQLSSLVILYFAFTIFTIYYGEDTSKFQWTLLGLSLQYANMKYNERETEHNKT